MSNKETSAHQAKQLDQFYTPLTTAQFCVGELMRLLPANADYNFVEPSAGRGSFMDAAQPYGPVIGFDIDPKRADIINADFLKPCIGQKMPAGWSSKNCVVIGNPPFGVNAKTALRFVNASASYTDTVAFVLPKSFRRFDIQKLVLADFKLIADLDLPSEKFDHCGREIKVGSCFQIWSRLPLGPDLRMKSPLNKEHPDFEMQRKQLLEKNSTPPEREMGLRCTISWQWLLRDRGSEGRGSKTSDFYYVFSREEPACCDAFALHKL